MNATTKEMTASELPVTIESYAPVEVSEPRLLTLIDLRINYVIQSVESTDENSEKLDVQNIVGSIKGVFEKHGVPAEFIEEASVVTTGGPMSLATRISVMEELGSLEGIANIENEIDNYFLRLREMLTQAYQRQDTITSIVMNPRDLELFRTGLLMMLPEEELDNIEFTLDEGINNLPQINLRSQEEAKCLVSYFDTQGLFKYLQTKGSPIVPNFGELRLVYLTLAALEARESNPQIIRAGGMDGIRLR